MPLDVTYSPSAISHAPTSVTPAGGSADASLLSIVTTTLPWESGGTPEQPGQTVTMSGSYTLEFPAGVLTIPSGWEEHVHRVLVWVAGYPTVDDASGPDDVTLRIPYGLTSPLRRIASRCLLVDAGFLPDHEVVITLSALRVRAIRAAYTAVPT